MWGWESGRNGIKQDVVTKLSVMAMVICAMVAIGFTLSAGYGAGHSAISQQEIVANRVKQYEPSHVDVIYERTIGGQQDFLHLEIDTTYHTIGKGGYTREVLCNRDFSLRVFSDGKYHDCSDKVAQCFVESDAQIKWQAAHDTKRIIAHECYKVVATNAEKAWEAWYTTSLPHLAKGARVTDNNSGVILEVRDTDEEYELKAKYITQYIG